MRISNLLAISWLLMGVFSISAPAALASPGDVSLNLENSWNNAFLGAAHPMGLAIDQDDNVYFVDSEQSIVFKMTGSSAPVHLITDILTPQGVAVDAAGNLYVAGWSDFAVYRVDPSGTDETVYASEIWDPTSVALDSAGNVYVTDYSSNVVYKITGVETKETIGSGFLNPYGIAVDPASNVYVTNSGGDTVSRITPGGSTSTILSELSSPAGIAVHPAGHIFVADSATGQIHVITPDERHLTLNEGLNGPKGLAFDSSNNLYVLDNTGLRKYTVTVESSAPPTLPVAYFSADKTSGITPLSVQFTDASTGYASSWQWNFGDGSENSTSQNPAHTFSAPGTYTVTLTAINANGTSTMQKSNYITTIAPTLPAADFSANPTVGLAPLNVQFTDASTGYASSWQWNFGDGSPNSTSQSPLHQYVSPGTYTVTLTAINANGSSTLERPVYVNVIAPTLPVADFSADKTSGLAPLDVQFTDASTGYASSWQWNFGDGSPNSTSQNPEHTFSAPGTYTVTLTAINANGSSTLHRAGYVTAIAPTLPVADFSANPTVGLAPLNVQFTDASTGYASSWQWNFGDGSSNSTEQSPLHQYASAGSYAVTLTAINANGSSTLQRPAYVTAGTPVVPAVSASAAQVYEGPDTRVDISYTLTNIRGGNALITVTDSLDQAVWSKYNGAQAAGHHSETWGGTYLDGTSVPDGQYTVKVSVDNETWGVTGIAGTDNSHFDYPYCAEVDGFGNVYVSDFGNQRVQVFDQAGAYVRTLGTTGSTGSDNSHFNGPRGLAVNGSGYLYVADVYNYRVQVFDPAGAYVKTVGTTGVSGTGNDAFTNPYAVAVNGSGYLYVADTFNHRVQVFDPAGAYLRTLGVTGTAGADNGHFNYPVDIAIDADDNLYVSDNYNRRVQVFDPAGAYVMTMGTTGVSGSDDSHFADPAGIALDGSGNVYVVEKANNRVQVFDAAGAYLSTMGTTGSAGSDDSRFNAPSGVAATGSGRIYVTDSGNNRLRVFHPGPVFSATDVLVVAPVQPVASFSGAPTTGLAPLAVTFADSSTGHASSWQWDFGDSAFGSANSTEQNPAHVYASAGTYTVTLTAINANGTSTVQRSNYVTVVAPTLPVADFSGNPTVGLAPLDVQFTDASTGYASSWEWDFGDGTPNSTEQSPVHQYVSAGTYAVTLTAINANGTSTVYRAGYVTVNAPEALVAGFTADRISGDAPLTVNFTDTSSGSPASWQWNFGDGSPNSTEQNPAHTYTTPGQYTVRLAVTNSTGATAGNSTQIEVRGPEEEPTSYTLSLRQGWNLVSFPVVNTSLQASSLQESGVLIVASYNRTTGDYDSFNTQVSPLTYDITLRTDVGYFLYCTRDTSIEVLGETPSRRSTTLYPGWNLVGWSSLTSSDAKSVVEEPSLTGRQIVAKFNATTGDYDAYAEGISLDSYNFPMDHGTSYFVYTDSATSQTLYFETLHD
ncbi:PKD domain-containing protein [Methanocella sp. MCL-LM]|uniref:PKD domain-containing protein n=1 Tax=Methanocella sp. MCL-LM TaxID=3412035 RepID=UPI003C711622